MRLAPAGSWERFWQNTFLVWAANFTVFIMLSFYLGGDAWNGHEEGGKYFLDSHGKLTEVTRAVFTYSWWHMFSVFVTAPFMFAAAFGTNRRMFGGNRS
jgi:hypothetical protein